MNIKRFNGLLWFGLLLCAAGFIVFFLMRPVRLQAPAAVHLKKHIARKERLAENDGLAAVLVRRIIAGQRHRDAVPTAVLRQLLLPPRLGMRDEPKQF